MLRRGKSIDGELDGIDHPAVVDDEMLDALMRDRQEGPSNMGHKSHADRLHGERMHAGAPYFYLYDDSHRLCERRKPNMGANVHPFDRRYIMEKHGPGLYRLMVEASGNGIRYHIGEVTVDESDLHRAIFDLF